jgi:DNA-binding CsgD family transcriptional regulator
VKYQRPTFTRSQRQILGLLVQGLSSRQIADRLGIATCSVDGCVARARRRIGARTNLQLVAMAVAAREVAAPKARIVPPAPS